MFKLSGTKEDHSKYITEAGSRKEIILAREAGDIVLAIHSFGHSRLPHHSHYTWERARDKVASIWNGLLCRTLARPLSVLAVA